MTQDTVIIVCLASPLVIGGIIAAINGDRVNNTTEIAEAWTRKMQTGTSQSDGWFSSYVANPILWIVIKFCEWTDGFTHRGLKNGARVAATLYLITAWCFILYVAFMMAVILVVVGVILYVVFKVVINSNQGIKENYERGRRIPGLTDSGERVNQETGIIEEKGLFGYKDTDKRIDPETGKLQTKGIFGWNDTETRVDQETGNIQTNGLLGYNDSDSRIDPETGIIQKKGLIGWIDTDERIDSETGRHQRKGLLGWSDD